MHRDQVWGRDQTIQQLEMALENCEQEVAELKFKSGQAAENHDDKVTHALMVAE